MWWEQYLGIAEVFDPLQQDEILLGHPALIMRGKHECEAAIVDQHIGMVVNGLSFWSHGIHQIHYVHELVELELFDENFVAISPAGMVNQPFFDLIISQQGHFFLAGQRRERVVPNGARQVGAPYNLQVVGATFQLPDATNPIPGDDCSCVH